MRTQLSLTELLQEPISAVIERERTELDRLLEKANGRIVLFGAGSLGRRALAELRGIGVEPLCISDNNPRLWGSTIDGCPLLFPADAAEKYGSDALFVVTIWNAAHWFVETSAQLKRLGCNCISSYSPIYWRFARTFLPFLLNDFPHRVYEDAANVRITEGAWSDQHSQDIYRALVYWYATGDASNLPGRPAENSYFPKDLFALSASEVLVDCGAFDGDTIRQLVGRIGKKFEKAHAIEADPLTLQKLTVEIERLEPELQKRIEIHAFAIGCNRKIVRFETTGTVDSKICMEGGVEVECIPLDEMLAETPVSMVKMDIEGAEYEALLGARKVIERDRPILAICVYHTQSDIWRIPLLVRGMVPEYKLYLRAYEGDGFQTVMYAVPPSRAIQCN